jgi:hypothetical protein
MPNRKPPRTPSRPAGTRLAALLVVLVLFFALPAALFVRLSGTEGPGRVAVMILALTLPATGALILRLNPDLLPDRAALGSLSLMEWMHLAVLTALLLGGVWWLTTPS